ncbi:hypothetical protein F2Q69_00006140 [Brassica cretica]|uniref:Uncharacterized protein n=1 Tax=Brassica cretica TaxID=69181 RepID=A0A8S9PD79_BRACR|nr:hypothetical protein F2Q69_00006140 [Brassica cretica]
MLLQYNYLILSQPSLYQQAMKLRVPEPDGGDSVSDVNILIFEKPAEACMSKAYYNEETAWCSWRCFSQGLGRGRKHPISSIPVESLFRTASHDINENCGFWMMRTKVCSYHLQVSIAHGFLMHPLLGVEQSSWQLSSPVGDSCDIF